MLQETRATLHETPATLQETRATLQETRPTLQETPATLHETPATLHETRATLQEARPTLQETPATLHETMQHYKKHVQHYKKHQSCNITRNNATLHETRPRPPNTQSPDPQKNCMVAVVFVVRTPPAVDRQVIDRESRLVPTPPAFDGPVRGSRRNGVWCAKTRLVWQPDSEDTFTRLDRMYGRDGQIYRQTPHDGIGRACIKLKVKVKVWTLAIALLT